MADLDVEQGKDLEVSTNEYLATTHLNVVLLYLNFRT